MSSSCLDTAPVKTAKLHSDFDVLFEVELVDNDRLKMALAAVVEYPNFGSRPIRLTQVEIERKLATFWYFSYS